VVALISLARTPGGKESVKIFAVALIILATACSALAQAAASTAANPAANLKVRYIIGLDNVKGNASGNLAVQDGSLSFKMSKGEVKVPVSSIDDVFLGAETTQGGGKTGRVVKTAAMAAPFESGKALTILLRTKVDIMTVAFHDPDGALHGAIFALPKGQGEPVRLQLVQAGAHTSPVAKEVSGGSKP
jgi:hypothetical protein